MSYGFVQTLPCDLDVVEKLEIIFCYAFLITIVNIYCYFKWLLKMQIKEFPKRKMYACYQSLKNKKKGVQLNRGCLV